MQEAFFHFGILAFVHSCTLACLPSPVSAQTAQATRLLILEADKRHALTPSDLAAIRSAARSGDADTAKIAVRALGRLQRGALIPDLLPSLKHALPEVRAEGAHALAQAAQGLKTAAGAKTAPSAPTTIGTTQAALVARLMVETDPSVRAAICEALARLPYQKADDVGRAEVSIVGNAAQATVADRLGMAEALEALARLHAAVRPLGAGARALLEDLARATVVRPGEDAGRGARIRRLALEALVAANALSGDVLERAAADQDAQVRRIAMQAAGTSDRVLQRGLTDPAPMVRLEALRGMGALGPDAACGPSLRAATDPDMSVALVAIDQLSTCGGSADAIAYLDRMVADRADIATPREWHAHAHALVALANAAPDRAAGYLGDYAQSPLWTVRKYAARAAAVLGAGPTLETLAGDTDDRVANIALTALGSPSRPLRPSNMPPPEAPTAADIRRLAAPRARITVRGVGRFELALFTTEAPGTVMRFVWLAEAGYFNGLSFDRLVPNVFLQGGWSRDAATLPEREISMWPHVRGAVGALTPETGDAQFFVNLVDNPRFDHRYTVFAQILNGSAVVDQILEGDVIQTVEIVP